MAEIDGEWQLVLDAPTGRSAPKLILKTDGTSISGTWKGQRATVEITRGELDGNRVTIYLELPVSGAVSLTVTVDGDRLYGEIQGTRGKIPVTGTRVGKSLPRI